MLFFISTISAEDVDIVELDVHDYRDDIKFAADDDD